MAGLRIPKNRSRLKLAVDSRQVYIIWTQGSAKTATTMHICVYKDKPLSFYLNFAFENASTQFCFIKGEK